MAEQNRTAADWEDIRYFLALARHGSLSAAARALGVNHATIARRIAALDTTLGAPLLERRPGGYVLTAAGRQAVQAAGAMERAAALLPRFGTAPPLGGLVRISAPPSLADAFLTPRFAPLMARHPGLDIALVAEHRTASLSRREADLALRLAQPEDGDVIARQVASLGFGCYAAPAWHDRLAAGAEPVFIGFDEANAHLPEALFLARRFPGHRLAFRAGSQAAQARAASAGYGIAVLPHFLGRADPGLACVALGETPPARGLWLLHRREASGSPVLAVRDYLVELFLEARPDFED